MKNRLWEFTYAPKKWEDLIINEELKEPLRKAIKERPNMFIYGPAGIGKGSFIDVLVNENDLKNSILKINASIEGGIETIREKVLPFSQAANYEIGKLKLVYLNEIDHPNIQASQRSLRDLMEATNKITQWCLLANYPENIIPELKSRCQSFHFNSPPAKEIYKRCGFILKNENVEFKKSSLVSLIKKCYPDIRNTIITLRQNVIDGKLKEQIIFNNADKTFDEIFQAIKTKDPEEVRKILKSSTIFYQQLYEYLYTKIMDNKDDDIFGNDAEMILLISEHLWRDTFVAIKEINFMDMIFKALKKGII